MKRRRHLIGILQAVIVVCATTDEVGHIGGPRRHINTPSSVFKERVLRGSSSGKWNPKHSVLLDPVSPIELKGRQDEDTIVNKSPNSVIKGELKGRQHDEDTSFNKSSRRVLKGESKGERAKRLFRQKKGRNRKKKGNTTKNFKKKAKKGNTKKTKKGTKGKQQDKGPAGDCLRVNKPFRTCFQRSWGQQYTCGNKIVHNNQKPWTARNEVIISGKMDLVMSQDDTEVDCKNVKQMEELVLSYLADNIGGRRFELVCAQVRDNAYYKDRNLEGDVVESNVLRLKVSYVQKAGRVRYLEDSILGMNTNRTLIEDYMESDMEDDDIESYQEERGLQRRCTPIDRAQCCSQNAVNGNPGQYCLNLGCNYRQCGTGRRRRRGPRARNLNSGDEPNIGHYEKTPPPASAPSVVERRLRVPSCSLREKDFNSAVRRYTEFEPDESLVHLDTGDIDTVAICSANRYSIEEFGTPTLECDQFVDEDCVQNDDLEPEIDIEDGGCTIDGVVAQPPTPRPTTEIPTAIPTLEPTELPTVIPTAFPTILPTLEPTILPTLLPTLLPTEIPTPIDTYRPTRSPELSPTLSPTLSPSLSPTLSPSLSPTRSPEEDSDPTLSPSISPTLSPSESPTFCPTCRPCRDDCSYQLSDNSLLTYQVNAQDIEMEIVHNGEAWLGLGFSTNGEMVGSEAVICVPTPGAETIQKYFLEGQDINSVSTSVVVMPENQQTLSNTSCQVVNGQTVMRFTKRLQESGEIEIISPGTNTMLFAHGSDTTLAYHSFRMSFELTL